MELSTTVTTTGPLFTGTAPRILRKVTNAAVEELLEEGQGFLFETLRPRPSGVYKTAQEAGRNASTGNYRRNIQTKVKNLSGTISDGGVIYGPWLEGTGSRNNSTRFKGYASFRKATQHMEKKASKTINKYMNKFIRRMNA
jgi:hypothetical protein